MCKTDEQDDGLLPNYMLNTDSSLGESWRYASSATGANVSGGGETAGTALTVAAYYRFIKLYPDLATDANTKAAAQAFDAVVASLDEDGWLTSNVNPMGPWVIDGTKSPEGESFVGQMWAARTAIGV